jgi:hypothetical protein
MRWASYPTFSKTSNTVTAKGAVFVEWRQHERLMVLAQDVAGRGGLRLAQDVRSACRDSVWTLTVDKAGSEYFTRCRAWNVAARMASVT